MNQIIDNKDIEKVVLEYILKVRQLEEETGLVLKERTEHLITRVLLRMNQNLKNLNQGKKYDPLYHLAEDMKQGYTHCIRLLDKGVELISDPLVEEILAGVRKMAVTSLAHMPSKSDNPITYERMVLINAGILRVKQFYQSAMESHDWSCSLGDQVSSAHILVYLEEQVIVFFDETMKDVLGLLDETLVLLADFSEGKKYQRFVEEQVRHLSTLALKQQEVIMAHLVTDEEKHYVTELLAALRQVHDLSEIGLANLSEVTEKAINDDAVMGIDQIDLLMKAHVFGQVANVEQLLGKGQCTMDQSINDLKGILSKEVARITLEVHQWMTDEAAGFQRLSGQMVNLFFETVIELETSPETYETDQGKAIVKGIKETLALKLESFREKDTNYQLGKKDVAIVLEQHLLEQNERFLQGAESLLLAVVAGDEDVYPKMERQFNDQVDEVKKRHFNYNVDYLRHELLFELKSYEELIEHSLRKLIELEPNQAKDITEILLATLEQSRVILSSHKIELIMPRPHDRFVGKYHEVMLAEEEEGFYKGEIIKTINIGYQLKKHVIIRASVLAAR